MHQIELQMPGDAIKVSANFSPMEQVMINLLTNAIKCSPNANRAVVTVNRVHAHTQIAVRDFGSAYPQMRWIELVPVFIRFPRINKL